MTYLLPYKIENALYNLYYSSSYMPSGSLITGSISSSFTFTEPLQIYKGEEHEVKAAPCIIISSQGSAEVVLFTGIMRCSTDIIVKEMAVDTAMTQTSVLADKVFEMILDPALNLPAYDNVGGLGVMDIIITSLNISSEGDSRVSTLSVDIIAGHG